MVVGFWNGSDSDMAGNSTGNPPRLPDAPLDLLNPLLEMGVARVDVAPGIDDRDHRLAGIVGAVIAQRGGARPLSHRPQILYAVPAVAAKVLWFLLGHCHFSLSTPTQPAP